MERNKNLYTERLLGKSRIYICGPITGMENLNKDEFATEKFFLQSIGKQPINPHDVVPTSVLEMFHDDEAGLWKACMRLCIKEVMTSDALIVLPQWHTSRGAIVEIFNAQTVGIPVFSAYDMEEIKWMFRIHKYIYQ